MTRRTLTSYGTLTAADTTARTLTYRLLPFGEQGRTSRGLVTVPRGVVTIPDPSAVVLNMEHDAHRPVGRATAIVDAGTALVATFVVAPTTTGDDLLAEADAGLRTGASVELLDVRIRDGVLTAGTLTGAGAVVAPAFPSALLVAADTDPDDDESTDDPPPGTPPTESDDPDEDTMTTTDAAPAAAPAGLAAAATPAPAEPSLSTVLDRLTAANRAAAMGDDTLMAALTDIGKPSADHMPRQWVGELWRGAADRRVIPLLGSGTLTGLSVTGWRWVVAPAVAAWAGDKAAVPSNAATTEPVTVPATRLAGAHDIPREHRDFDTGFIPSYYAAMTASYGVLSDEYAAAQLLAGATPGVNVADPVGAILSNALAVGAIGQPTFALLAPDVFASLAGVKASDAPAFLDLTLTFDGNAAGSGLRAVSVPTLPAKTVLVGDRRAATVHELPGVPIRAEALDMVKGGVDAGVFGYCAVVIHDARALVKNLVQAPAAR